MTPPGRGSTTIVSTAHKITYVTVAAIAFLSFFLAIYFLWPRSTRQSRSHPIALLFVLLWGLAPAIWFFLESRIWKSERHLARRQQYARDFWLGAGAVILTLAAVALGASPGPSSPTNQVVIAWNLVADVVKAMLWPVVTISAFILFHEPLGAFLSSIGMRVSKIGVPGLSLELGALPEAKSISAPILDELKAASPFVAMDSSGALFAAIAGITPVDYVKVDLEDGLAWLTSRLFILAVLIPRVRPVQRIVFVCDPSEKFVGECRPLDMAQALAGKYHWLEDAYVAAHNPEGQGSTFHLGTPFLEPLPPTQASIVLGSYLNFVRQNPQGTAEWTSLPNYQEHAVWVGEVLLVNLLGTSLKTIPVKRDFSEDGSVAARALLRHDQGYVAVTDVNGRFVQLIDRRKAVDQVIRAGLAASRKDV